MAEEKVILEIEDLYTSFHTDTGVVPAVDGITVSLKKGETLGIVGESGSGKSVTALSIMRLFAGTTGKVDSGKIVFDKQKDLLTLSDKEMRSIRGNDIAMIFQEPMTSLNPVMKIGKQITESVLLHEKVSEKEAKERALEMLEKVQMPRAAQIMNEYPFRLSGGQRQRVMIALALVCNPQILIADEPTTALDVTIQAQILRLMNQLQKEINTSIIMITHDLGVVAETCNEVVVMYCGRIVEQSTVYDLFDNPSHPYTQGLLESMPKLGSDVDALESIPGNVPNPKFMPKGCKFAPRCKFAMDICQEQEPPFFAIRDGHKSKCWLNDPATGGVKK